MRKFLLALGVVAVLMPILAVGLVCWASRGALPKQVYEAGFVRELASAPDGQAGGRYRIVTYNVGYASGLTNNSGNNASEQEYSENIQKIIAALRKVSPDIVACQEIDFASARSYAQDQPLLLAEGLGLRYRAGTYTWDMHYVPWPYGTPSHHFGRMLSGHCVLSRFPVVKNSKITMPKPGENPFWYNLFYLDRIIQVTEIAVGSQPLIILNVHLEAYKRKTREAQGRTVAETIRQYADKPLIVLGDFNARSPWETEETTLASILAVEGMRKEFPQELYEGGDEAKYHTASSGRPRKSIDHILFNDKITCLKARVLQDAGTGSDHLPVMMEFAFK